MPTHGLGGLQAAGDDVRKLALEVMVALCENAAGMMRKLPEFPTQILTLCLQVCHRCPPPSPCRARPNAPSLRS